MKNFQITRVQNILTGASTMKDVYTIKDMPVHFGCVDSDHKEDLFMDQKFIICKETGIIQIEAFPTSDLLYLTKHNDAIGKTWSDLFSFVSEIVSDNIVKESTVLEIGGGCGSLAKMIIERLVKNTINATSIESTSL